MEESLRNISVTSGHERSRAVTSGHMTSAGEGEMVNEFQLINALVSSWTCPTCDCIEKVWGVMKCFLRDKVKPKTLGDLKAGIIVLEKNDARSMFEIRWSSCKGTASRHRRTGRPYRALDFYLYYNICHFYYS